MEPEALIACKTCRRRRNFSVRRARPEVSNARDQREDVNACTRWKPERLQTSPLQRVVAADDPSRDSQWRATAKSNWVREFSKDCGWSGRLFNFPSRRRRRIKDVWLRGRRRVWRQETASISSRTRTRTDGFIMGTKSRSTPDDRGAVRPGCGDRALDFSTQTTSASHVASPGIHSLTNDVVSGVGLRR